MDLLRLKYLPELWGQSAKCERRSEGSAFQVLVAQAGNRLHLHPRLSYFQNLGKQVNISQLQSR